MRTVRDDLAAIADAAPLVALLTTSRSPHMGPGGHPAPGTRPPVNVAPIALLEDVHNTLVAWVRLVVDEDGLDYWPADTIPACCTWLIGRLDYLTDHPAADEFGYEIRGCWRRMRDAIGERPARRPRCRCGSSVDGMDEHGARTEDQALWRWCACPACGLTYTFDAALRGLGRARELTVPAYAEEAGVHERTLRRWVKTWEVQAAGLSRGGPVYARADLDALVVRMGDTQGERVIGITTRFV